MTTPFFAIGNDELEKKNPLGETFKCPHCGLDHPVEFGDEVIDGVKVPSTLLAFYKCGEKTYLCGINGKAL
jgi:hypothetical protein